MAGAPTGPRYEQLAEQARLAFDGDPLLRPHADFAFEIKEPLGEGGMGIVQRVFDRRNRREAALKTLKLADNPERVERFVREARVSTLLEHPSIPPVYEYGRMPSGDYYMLLKLIRGKTLTQQIAEFHAGGKAARKLRRLLRVVGQVCEALAYAHSKGVLHRDLKPDNVMLGRHGQVYVLDWGLARGAANQEVLRSKPGETQLTGSVFHMDITVRNRPIGTFAYMPPEQAAGQEATELTDVWAIGAILYEVLTGESPYSGGGMEAAVLALEARIPDLTERTSQFPPSLVALVQQCLLKNPSERPASPTEIADRLENLAPDVRDYARKTLKSSPLGLAVAALVGAVLVAGLWGVLGVSQDTLAQARNAGEQARSQRERAEEELAETRSAWAAAKAEADQEITRARAAEKQASQALARHPRQDSTGASTGISPLKEVEALLWRAEAAARRSDGQGALEDVQRAIELDPNAAKSHFALAKLKVATNDFEGAARSLERAIEVDPDFPDAFGLRAQIAQERGDLHAAARDYDRVLALDPRNVVAANNGGNVHHRLGNPARALEIYDAILERIWPLPDVHTNRGYANLALGNPSEAVRDLETALSIYHRSDRRRKNAETLLVRAKRKLETR